MSTKIRVEFTQQRTGGDVVAAITWEYPTPWKDNRTERIVDPLTETVLPAAEKAIAIGASKTGDLVATARNIRHEVVHALKEYQPLSMEVWRADAPDRHIILT